MTAKETGLRGKVRDGKVVSDKMQKTIVVAIEANFRHRLYKKTVRRVRRFMAHDARDEAKLGDRVRIVEASPISRRKRWRLLEVLTRADLPEVAPESIDLELLGEVKPEVEEAEAVAEEAVSSPGAEAVMPEEIAVVEEVPEVEEAASELVDALEAEDLATEEDQLAEEEPAVEEEEPAQAEEAAVPDEEAAPEDETEEKPE